MVQKQIDCAATDKLMRPLLHGAWARAALQTTRKLSTLRIHRASSLILLPVRKKQRSSRTKNKRNVIPEVRLSRQTYTCSTKKPDMKRHWQNMLLKNASACTCNRAAGARLRCARQRQQHIFNCLAGADGAGQNIIRCFPQSPCCARGC